MPLTRMVHVLGAAQGEAVVNCNAALSPRCFDKASHEVVSYTEYSMRFTDDLLIAKV